MTKERANSSAPGGSFKFNERKGGLELDRRELFAGASVLGAGLSLPLAQTCAAATAQPPRLTGTFPQRSLMKANLNQLLDRKNLTKQVLDRLIIDDMENDGGWHASDAVSLTYTAERAKSGTRAMRFGTALRNDRYILAARSKNGTFNGQGVLFAGPPFSAFISKRIEPIQDWSRFNRLSLWCYVHSTNNPVNTLSLQFVCEGAEAGPSDPISVTYFAELRSGEWNHLVWEIPEMRRDRISQIVIFQPLEGTGIYGAQSEIVYDFDELAVELVDAERVGGWSMPPNKIGFSHLGYEPAAEKIAISSVGAANFSLLDEVSGSEVATLPVTTVNVAKGAYGLLDFSDFSRPGTYRLRHGDAVSEPFAIAKTAWLPLVEATLNAFYGFRCGFAVERAHGACHLDVYAEYRGERRVVGGGWHDAANLTQGPYRTHLSIYALLELRDAMLRQGEDALAERALEEARWGLEWSIRCRFGPGMRVLYGEYSYWTDSKPGTIDDVVQDDERSRVGRDPFQNTLASLATARASRAFKKHDPKLAALLERAAREDFADVMLALQVPSDATPREINEPSWRDRIAYLTLTAAELLRTTGDPRFEADAVRLAKLLEQTQERRFVDSIAVTGYFYEDAARTRLVHEYHNSFEDSGLLAFAVLCEILPDHSDWISWYAGLAAYADYFCAKGSEASAPFGVVPAAVWRRADLDAPLPPDQTGKMLAAAGPNPVFPTAPTPQLIRAQMQTMFDQASDLGADHRLRIFPLWSDHVRHGATTVHMSKTIGLGAAATAMARPDLSELASRQLQWVIGANPFSRSLIYGVGNDFWQNFSGALPNLVGGLSLGFNSYADDAPAWGNNAVFPYKEQWVYSSCRIALNLARIGIPAVVAGRAPVGATFRNLRSGDVAHIRAGKFETMLPAGSYEVKFGGAVRLVSLAQAGKRSLNLDPSSALGMTVAVTGTTASRVKIRLTLEGVGRHTLSSRVYNGTIHGIPNDVVLSSSTPSVVELELDVHETDRMWLLAIVPDGQLQDRIELNGSATPLRPIA